MTDRDRFRGQDPDNQYGQEDYAGQDDTPSSMSDDETRDQGGRMARGDYSGQGDYSSDSTGGVRSPRSGEKREPSRQEDEHGTLSDEYGTHGDEYGTDDTGGAW